MAYDEALAERLRERLAEVGDAGERKMFGGLTFMVNGNMAVGVMGDDLIVRLAPDDAQAALAQPGAREFDFTGRPMRGWVVVAGEALDDEVLDQWVAQACAHNATLPPK